MRADFYKAFRKEESPRILPKKVVTEVNKGLPKGYSYERDKKTGIYYVQPNNKGESQIINGSIDYKKNNIPETIPREQLLEYAYRMQKKIEFDPTEIDDGEKVYSTDDVFKDPITGESKGERHYYILPKPFPSPAPVSLQLSDGRSIEVMVQRQPYDKMDQIKLENVSFPSINIIWIIPEKKGDAPGTITISASPKKAETVADVIVSLQIVQEFLSRKLKIDGVLMGKNLSGNPGNIEDEHLAESIVFWSNIEKLEKILQVRFNPQVDLAEDDFRFSSELFKCFIEEQDLVYAKPIKHFHLGIQESSDAIETCDTLTKHPGISLSFVGERPNCTLLGAHFTLYESNVLVDMIVDRVIIDEDKKGIEVFISDAPGASFRVIRRFYLTMDEAQENMQRMFTQHTVFRGEIKDNNS